jgi:triosephosphate isomerase
MYKTPSEARVLAREVRNGLRGVAEDVDVAVCPPFTALPAVAEVLAGSPVAWGAQNCAPRPEGAFTGEVSAPMLVDLDCRFAILGHSERRQLFGETDSVVREKLKAVLDAELTPIVCIGETLAEREGGRTEEVVDRQLRGALAEIAGPRLAEAVIAYEPVWAIGTGKTATPEQAEVVHARIRSHLASLCGQGVAQGMRILYGGSVKPDNAGELFARENIDGGLIGGASLDAKSFLAIVRAACCTG